MRAMKILLLFSLILLSGCVEVNKIEIPRREKLKDMYVNLVTPTITGGTQDIEDKKTEIGDDYYLIKDGYLLISDDSITPKHRYVKIFISKSKALADGYSEVSEADIQELLTSDGIRISYNKLNEMGYIKNGSIINIKVYNSDNNIDFEFLGRIIQPSSLFSAIKMPILYRLNGSFGDFFLSNFSPAISLSIYQKNLLSRKIEYLSIDALLSTSLNQETKNTYALIAGTNLDIGGWIQLGVAWHFGEGKLIYVLGIRPESLFSENIKALQSK